MISRKRISLAVLSVIFFFAATQQLVSLALTSTELRSASLAVAFSNDSSQSLTPLVFFYIESSNSFNFSESTINVLRGTNVTVLPIEDGSGIQLYSEDFEPFTSVEFQVDNIELVEIKSNAMLETRVTAHYDNVNATDVSYHAVFAIYGVVGFYHLSVSSLHTFTDKTNGTVIYRTDHRDEVLSFLKILYVVVLAGGVLLLVGAIKPRLIIRLPFVTLSIVGASIFLYVFVGSGFEINLFNSMKDFRLLFPVAFLIHGYDQHIKGNLLPYFTLLSLLFESWLLIKSRLASFFWWYIVPLFLDSVVWGTVSYVMWGRSGFGLSLAIEAMTWTLWAYLIKNYQQILKRKHDVLFTVLAGIPSFAFLGWLLGLVYNPTPTAYYSQLGSRHVVYGLLTMMGVFSVVFGEGIMNWFRLKVTGARAKTLEVKE